MNEFRKRLKEVGMYSEFQDWMKTPPKRDFCKGSRIQVIEVERGNELFFGLGDKGTIISELKDNDYKLAVRFDEDSSNPNTWFIRRTDVKIIGNK